MSSRIVTKLAFTGPSYEPHLKLTCPFSSGTEGLSNRSSRMTPSLCCSTYSIPISFTLSTQKSRTINSFKSKYASLASSSIKRLQDLPSTPETKWNGFSLPTVVNTLDLWLFQLIHDSLQVLCWSISSLPPVSDSSQYRLNH